MKTRQCGKIMRFHRESMGLSIEKAAELCGMSYKGLGEIELGDSDPKLSSVLSIITAFKIDLNGLNSCIAVLS